MADSSGVSELLDERPELDSALRTLLDVDEREDEWSLDDAWTFDDLPVDSGTFGELVSRGVVENVGDGYRVADPAAVRAALDDGAVRTGDDEHGSADGDERPGPSFGRFAGGASVRDRVRDVDRTAVGALLGALFLLALVRAYVFPSVFRDGSVVLSGNDPYYYRYWVERALVEAGGRFDFGGLAVLPEAVRTGEPLLVSALWFVAALLGGGATAAGRVLAWYPVVTAVITGFVLYLLVVELTDDRRVALAAVAMLAITPGHAFRTSLGFADHHAFDYVWLVLTAYALVVLDGHADGRRVPTPRQGGAAVLLGVAVAGQVLAWDAGPLLLLPLGGYAAVRSLLDVRDGNDPLAGNLGLVAGVALATGLVFLVHSLFDWQSTTVALSPLLLVVGILGVLAAGTVAVRIDASPGVLAGVEVGGLALGVVGFRTLVPGYWSDVAQGIDVLVRQNAIAETQSLFGGGALGWLLLFGFVLALGVPYLVWASLTVYRGTRRWTVPVVYAWYFLVLAAFQVRFAGQLAIFNAVFAGFGFVHVASTVDVSARPRPLSNDETGGDGLSLPDGQRAGYLLVLFLLVGSLSFVQVPVKIDQVTAGDAEYDAAVWMNEHADEVGWTYPENYVFSSWGENRLYNYFVNGQSRSYGFAQDNFGAFANARGGEEWYNRLRDRTGFVVVGPANVGAGTVHGRLYEAYGSRNGGAPGLSHYRAVYATDDGKRKVFTLVPGATITGPAMGESASASVPVTAANANFSYERSVAGEHGVYSITVPYPGEYAIGDRTIEVTNADVSAGATYETFDGPGLAHWSFDEGEGTVAYDRWGGHHMRLEGTSWTDGSVEIRNRSSAGVVDDPSFLSVGSGESLTVQLTLRGNLSESPETYPRVLVAEGKGQIGLWAQNDADQFGVRFDGDDGTSVKLFPVDDPDFESPTTLTVVLDRSTDELRLYADGTLEGTTDASGLGAVTAGDRLNVGGGWGPYSEPSVAVSDLRVYNESRSPGSGE